MEGDGWRWRGERTSGAPCYYALWETSVQRPATALDWTLLHTHLYMYLMNIHARRHGQLLLPTVLPVATLRVEDQPVEFVWIVNEN